MNIDVIKLENGKEYGIIDTITHNGSNYLVLSNILDNNDFCIRKVIEKEGREVIVKLNDQNEFEEIMKMFYNKHKGELINEK